MKKLAALILVLLLAAPAAFAGNLPIGGGLKATPAPEQTQAPEMTEAPAAAEASKATEAPAAADILGDPTLRYTDFVDPEDPASIWFLRMIDSANDEPALVATGMAIRQESYNVDADGTETLQSDTYLYDTPYGMVLDMKIDLNFEGLRLYMFPDMTIMANADDVVMTQQGGYAAGYFLMPSDLLNSYDPVETLLAMRAEGDGYAYLTDGGNGYMFEYIADARLRYYEIRTYQIDADGAWHLTRYGLASYIETPQLPEAVADAMK